MICTNTENVTARKSHKCHSCGEAIEAGQTYKRWACFDNGSASTVKMHPSATRRMTKIQTAALGSSRCMAILEGRRNEALRNLKDLVGNIKHYAVKPRPPVDNVAWRRDDYGVLGIWTGFRTVEIAFDGDPRCKRCEAKA